HLSCVCVRRTGGSVSPWNGYGSAQLQRTRYLRGNGARWGCTGALSPGSRSRSHGRPAVCPGHDAPAASLCDFYYWVIPHSFDSPAAWIELRLSFNVACCDRNFHSALFAVWKVLPHIPTPGADRSAVLQRCRCSRPTGEVLTLPPGIRFANARR